MKRINFTAEEIQKKFDGLPEEVKIAISSSAIKEKIQILAKRYDLMIDQTGELVDEIGLLMLGLVKSQNFIDDVIERCGIDAKRAKSIAQDVNQEIFTMVRQQMQKINTDETGTSATIKDSHIDSLEKAGDFIVEKDKVIRPSFQTPEINRDNLKDGMKSMGNIEIRDEHNNFYHEPPVNLPGAIEETDINGRPLKKNNPLVNVPKYDGSDPYHEALK
jgi:hypothetical protein